MPDIQFTPALLRRLKGAYAEAVKQEKDSFLFYGNVYDTGYARYLIEYLDKVFNK